MTITDEQKAKLLDAYRDNYYDYYSHQGNQLFNEGWVNGLYQALEILGLSAEAEQIRKGVAGD